MRRLILIIFIILFFSFPAYAIKPGVYFCYTENLVGIQSSKKLPVDIDGDKIWEWLRDNRKGSVLKPNIKKFTIKVKKLGVKDYELQLPEKKMGQSTKKIF